MGYELTHIYYAYCMYSMLTYIVVTNWPNTDGLRSLVIAL